MDKTRFSPVFHAIGKEDEVFDVEPAVSFDQQLKRIGIESRLILEGKGPSFDMIAEAGDEVNLSVIMPAVDFAEISYR